MIAANETKSGSLKGLSEVVGIDFGATGTKVVRMKRSKEGLLITGVTELSPVTLETSNEQCVNFSLPKSVRSRNVAFAYSGRGAIVRLVNVPGFSRNSANADDTVRSQVGLDRGYRLGYTITSLAGRGKQEVSLIAVGVPSEETEWLLELVTKTGPSPVSMEVSALASLTAFVRGPANKTVDGAVGIIEAGEQVTMLAIFSNGDPILLRKFEFGYDQILDRVSRQFGVDRVTAHSVLSEHSIDVSQPVQEAVGSFLRQLAISKEFVERKVGTQVREWFLTGGLANADYWREKISKTVGKEAQVWNPLGNLFLAQDVWPSELEGQEVRFSAAIGLAIGALEDA